MSSLPSSSPTSSSTTQYVASVHGAYGFTSTVLGEQIKPDPNSQTMIGYWLNELSMQETHIADWVGKIRDLTSRLNKELAEKGSLSRSSIDEATEELKKLARYSFSCNGILEEAWERCIIRTKSNKTYTKVGAKFADNFDNVLSEIAKSSPADKSMIDTIGRVYINKHHLKLKSIYPNLQIAHDNIVHAGAGSATTGNSEFHKALHELTALSGGVDYRKMNAQMTDVIEGVVDQFGRDPGHANFNRKS